MAKPPLTRTLKLGTLRRGYPCLSRESGVRLASAAAVCLEERGHEQGVVMSVRGESETSFSLHWPDTTDQMRREWADPQEATENGAVAVAILLVDELTDYDIVQRSYKGTGFDYWLGVKRNFLFQHAARLEVSGIRHGDERQVDARVKSKVKQTERSSGENLPAVVVVVEFGTPASVMVIQ